MSLSERIEQGKILMYSKIAENINILGEFCGKRDVSKLNQKELLNKYGIEQADVMVLFGGSILAGGDIFAKAIKDKIEKKYIIVGGAGHTTETLRKEIHQEYPKIQTANLSEVEVFQKYLQNIYNCQADYLKTESTNCGNNITYLLDLLKKNHIEFKSIILCQDATMQNRMDAGIRKYVTKDVKIINYAAYVARVIDNGKQLAYENVIHGMWKVERYVNLLMGEIPRLTDNENGYGPNGKNFIAHVEIPENVKNAFEELKLVYGKKIREANPLYSSRG